MGARESVPTRHSAIMECVCAAVVVKIVNDGTEEKSKYFQVREELAHAHVQEAVQGMQDICGVGAAMEGCVLVRCFDTL
jgi:hypothetical protein